MGWLEKVSATQVVVDQDALADADWFNQVVMLSPGEVAHCEVEYNAPSTPTDDCIVAVEATLDESSENWDDTPILTFTISKSPDPNKRSFTVSGVYKFRVGVYMSGATDTTGTADFSYRKDGVSA